MNEINKKENIKLEVEKGSAALRQAKILYDSHEYDGAVSRSYYAAFHYVTALLLTKGIETTSHDGLIRMFHLHFIKSSLFPKKYGAILSHVEKAREESDYWSEVTASEEDAKSQFNDTQDLIQVISNYLDDFQTGKS